MKNRAAIALVGLFISSLGYFLISGNANKLLSRIFLASALSETLEQVYERLEESPLDLLSSLYSKEEGMYTADTEISFENNQKYRFHTNADIRNRQFRTLVTTTAHASALDIYIDPSILAFSDPSNEQHIFWGIRYNTFLHDLSQYPLIAQLFDLEQCQTIFTKIATVTSKEHQIPAWLRLTESDMEKLLLGILTLPCRVEFRTISQNSTDYKCTAFSYPISDIMLQEAISYGFIPEKTENMDVTFYLYNKKIIKTIISVKIQESSTEIIINCNEKIQNYPIIIEFANKTGARINRTSIQLTKQNNKAEYSTIKLYKSSNKEEYTLNYHWNSKDECWEIQYKYKDNSIDVQLKKYNGILQIRTYDLPIILKKCVGILPSFTKSEFILNIQPDAIVEKPEYKTSDVWNMDDIWSIISCLSDWFGAARG